MTKSDIGNLIEQVESGNLSLRADAATFVVLEKACEERIFKIAQIKSAIRAVADQEVWGIGEQAAVLTSAQTLVRRFREKAADGPNNAYDTLEGHRVAAEELLTLFRTIRKSYEVSDAEFAAKFKELASAQGLDIGE
ncbi:hypothetical protein ACFC06_17685 [Nocardia sp. NPDC056064]|uniref:hypothetical protein n=1 Tax=Nocardia sp. NPDC056064 TaxID=3345701 RepID=UPI0035E309A4